MALDLDGALLFHLVAGGKTAVDTVKMKGITPEHFSKAKHRQVFDVIVSQVEASGSAPTYDDIKSIFGPVIAPSGMALDWVVAQIHRRLEFNKMGALAEAIVAKLNDNDPAAAKELLLAAADVLRVDPTQAVQVASLFSLGEDVKKEYNLSESGVIAVPTPWDSVNAMTMGLYPGTSTWLLARPGVGKTWVALIMSVFAWFAASSSESPCKVLLISPEMSKVRMAERLYALLGKIGYGGIVGGTLGAFAKDAFFKEIDKHALDTGLFILDASDGITPERVELAIEQVGADLVVVDSVYKIRWMDKPKDRFENMYRGVDVISSWAKRRWAGDRAISILAVSQLNRQADQKGGKNKSAVALADNLNWEADNLFFLEQDDDMKADMRMALLPEKVRRQSAVTSRVEIRWDMQGMVFDEIKQAKKKPVKQTFGEGDF